MKRKIPVIISILTLVSFLGFSQIPDTVINVHLVRVGMSFSAPAGDMAARYGVNGGVGGSYYYKTSGNFQIGVDYEYLFGGNVKQAEEIFDNITASNGNIIDATGGMAIMDTYERGFSLMLSAGKVFPGVGKNPNSGILVSAGAGYLSHHLTTEVYMNLAPQIFGDYAKGYDRLTGGPVYSIFAGYQNIDPQNIFNYYIGLDFKHAMTKPLRNYQFDLKGPEPDNLRHDLFIAIKLGWMLPLYRRSTDQYYYY